MKPWPPVLTLVRWRDNCHSVGWKDAGTVDTRVIEIESVGYLIHEDNDIIVVAQSVSDDNDCNDRLTILKICVLERFAMRRAAPKP